MVMVAVRAKGALWRENASLFVSLAISVVNRGPTMVDVTLHFRETPTKCPLKVRTTSSPICKSIHCIVFTLDQRVSIFYLKRLCAIRDRKKASHDFSAL